MKALKKSVSVILAIAVLLSLISCLSACKGTPGEQGPRGEQGEDGAKGEKGDDGKGIVSVIKTATSGLVDTYTIIYTNGTTTTFEVTNGEQGLQGAQGPQGETGKSAYEIAVEYGFQGTVEEWLESLKADNSTQDDQEENGENNTDVWEDVNVTIYVLVNRLNVRSAADTKDSDILGIAKMGDSFVATAADKDWYKILYDGKEAYVMAAYVTTNSAEAEFVDCEAEVIKIKNTVVDPNATKDIDKYAKVMLRTDPIVSDATSTKNVLIYSDTANGELVKVAANKAGTWYKVTYNNNTFYIASGAFKYFEGYTGGNVGGLG